MALKLFTFFAQEWEDKNNRLPMRARQWWYKHSDKAEIILPVKRTLDHWGSVVVN
jgi:hypothetical protein